MDYKFIFLRHGRSLADDEGKHEGLYDSPLTEIGVLAGLTFEEAEIKYPEPKNRNIFKNFPCKSGENEIQFNSRALLCINSMLKRKTGKYLIVAHGKILNAIIK